MRANSNNLIINTMKKTYLVVTAVLIMITATGVGQTLTVPKTGHTIEVSPDLYAYVREYFEQIASVKGVDLTRFNKLKSIQLSNHMLGVKAYGLTIGSGKENTEYYYILVAAKAPHDFVSMIKLIVWHEMYHVYSESGSHFAEPSILQPSLLPENVMDLWTDEERDKYKLQLVLISNGF